jgi:GNAT superfamily N-acetyltransferase
MEIRNEKAALRSAGKLMDITLTLEPQQADIDVLVELITAANEANDSGPAGYQPVGMFIRDSATDAVIGGLSGYTLFDWLFVQFLAVPPEMRGKGAGTELLNRAEAWSRERGLVGIWLDTFAFGAPKFYEARGFTVFGTIEDHPVGSRRFFYAKRLEGPTA